MEKFGKHYFNLGLPGWLSGTESACKAGATEDAGLITGLGRSPAWEDPLEEGIVTHLSILSWRIPLTKQPGGLQSIGFQIVGCD